MLKEPKAMRGQRTVAHVRSPKQERDLARKLNGRRVKASGAKDEKGDVRVEGVARIEAKTTAKRSFIVRLEDVQKIETAAVGAAEIPAMVVEFCDSRGRKIKDVAVVPLWALQLALGRK